MKIFCVGRNYAEHAKELNNAIPTKPVIFMKPATALLKDGKPFYLPDFSNDMHYETELVLRVGKNGKAIQEKFALGYVDAMTVGIDFTARDLQDECKKKGLPWEIAKAFDHSAVVGKFVSVDTDKLKNGLVEFRMKLNGEQKQQGKSGDMIFNTEQIVAYVSKFFTLQTGDLIYTGTPSGVGAVKQGDTIEAFLNNENLLTFDIK
ncbi:MAG TPA: fumarylacetoacetate hydrolase family protein [Chitinophagales bacterium]|nr:fumarylacetoacetate hydrolase family protein [Chitinophagales bacterium]